LSSGLAERVGRPPGFQLASGPTHDDFGGFGVVGYPYEVRDEKEYFDEIQDVKVTKDARSGETHRQPEGG
jgi:hypothetical protein